QLVRGEHDAIVVDIRRRGDLAEQDRCAGGEAHRARVAPEPQTARAAHDVTVRIHAKRSPVRVARNRRQQDGIEAIAARVPRDRSRADAGDRGRAHGAHDDAAGTNRVGI
ncbi:MAG: hypothetical protein ACK56F_32775, partial [bacterium]